MCTGESVSAQDDAPHSVRRQYWLWCLVQPVLVRRSMLSVDAMCGIVCSLVVCYAYAAGECSKGPEVG